MRAGVPIDLTASSRFANRLRAELAADKGLAAFNGGADPVIPAGSLIAATGHSLGGHLALLFGRLFPSSVHSVFTYNAPGISVNGERLLRLLGVQPIGDGMVANVASAMGAEAISRIWGKPGAKIGVHTEPGGAIYTHSIVPLSDALALYGVFATLAPALSTNYQEIARLISASSVRPERSLEQALDYLRNGLGFAPGATQIASQIADTAQRESYFARLYQVLDGRIEGKNYEIEMIGDMSAPRLVQLASSDASIRYALSELMPFAIRKGDYSEFEKVFSQGWLTARSEMLGALTRGNLEDLAFLASGTSESYFFEDKATGSRVAMLIESDVTAARLVLGSSQADQLNTFLRNVPYARSIVFGSDLPPDGEVIVGLAGADRLFGGSRDDTLDGAAGNDHLEGGAGDDDLFGGAGNDSLYGGLGVDWLAGGAGFDAYRLDATLDADTIQDRDGRIFAGANLLHGGTREGEGAYLSSDGLYSYAFAGDLEAGGILLVNGALRIEGFVNGDLGIQLTEGVEQPPVTPPEIDALLVGDLDYEAFHDPAAEYRDPYGNPLLTAFAVPVPARDDRSAEFPGTPGNTHFKPGAGNDTVADLFDGDDWIELAAGNDSGSGGVGNDLIEGGPGTDVLMGGDGDDVLVGGSLDTLEADLNAPIDPLQASPFREHLSGGDGDDVLFGSAVAGRLEGGAGNDLILGGGAADLIFGGEEGSPGLSGDDVVDAGGGDDSINLAGGEGTVWGGEGNDRIFAAPGEGTTYLDGGDGDDQIISSGSVAGNATAEIFGGAGNDTIDATGVGGSIFGGAGRDFIFADGAFLIDGGPGDDHMEFNGSNPATNQSVLWGAGSGSDTGVAVQGSYAIVVTGDVAPHDISVRWASRPLEDVFLMDPGPGAGPGPGPTPGPGPGTPGGPPPPRPEFEGIEFSLTGTGDALLVQAPADPDASRSIQVEFSDGTVWDDAYIRALLSPVPDPDPDADSISPIQASAGDDLSYGSETADSFPSSSGNDWSIGGAGGDRYAYARGDGFDWIEDVDSIPGNIDILRFADGIVASEVGVFAQGGDYILALDDGGVLVRGGRTHEGAVERIEFADGTAWAAGDLEGRAVLLPDNRPPEFLGVLENVAVKPGAAVSVAIPRESIVDLDRFDSLSFYAITGDGDRLPQWLSFDSAALTLSGTPTSAAVGDHEIFIIASDSGGGAAFGRMLIAVEGDPAVADGVIAATEPPEAIAQSPEPVLGVPPFPEPDGIRIPQSVAYAEPRSTVGIPLDPLYREMTQRFDVLLQVGRANLSERYAGAIREFEERRRQREAPAEPPPPTEEEIMAHNRAMHAWHDRNPGFTDVDGVERDGVWAAGWGIGGGERSFEELVNAGNAPNLMNPNALPKLGGAARNPGLSEGLRDLR